MSINNNTGVNNLAAPITNSAIHQIQLTNLLQQSPQQQNGLPHQQQLTTYTINNNSNSINKDNSNNGHFIAAQVTTASNNTDEAQNGTNGEEILAKLMHVTKREKRNSTRNGRVSSVILFYSLGILNFSKLLVMIVVIKLVII